MDFCVSSLSSASLVGCLLAYCMRTNRMREMMGILITIVSSATTMMNIGLLGGGARVHVNFSLLQLHRDASVCTLEGASVQLICGGDEDGLEG